MFYTRTEKFVKDLLLSFNIKKPADLGIDKVADALQVTVHLWEFGSEAICRNGKYIIFLNEQKNERVQWQEFTHEVGHIMWHVGRQELLPPSFIELQEWQANYFSCHLCIPTFMLEESTLKMTPYKLMELFNVEYAFACKRMEMLENKRGDYRSNLS